MKTSNGFDAIKDKVLVGVLSLLCGIGGYTMNRVIDKLENLASITSDTRSDVRVVKNEIGNIKAGFESHIKTSEMNYDKLDARLIKLETRPICSTKEPGHAI